MPTVFIFLTAVYAGLGAFAWHCQQQGLGRDYPWKTELPVLGAALTVHGAALLMPVIQDKIIIMGFGYSGSLIVWMMLFIYFAGSFFYSLRGVQLLLYPCAALMLLSGLVFPGKFSGYEITDLPFMLHIGTSLLAYGLFGIATLIVRFDPAAESEPAPQELLQARRIPAVAAQFGKTHVPGHVGRFHPADLFRRQRNIFCRSRIRQTHDLYP